MSAVELSPPMWPRICAASGRPLSRPLSVLHRLAATRGGGGMLIRRLGTRFLVGRLPLLELSYPDGRRLRVPERDKNFAAAFFYGEYEPVESVLVRALVEQGDFVVDVGANLGWYSVLMNAAVGSDGTVWAFEPIPPARELLRSNLALNPGHVVTVHPCALGAQPGEIELFTFAGLPLGHASGSTLGRSDYLAHRIQLDTLDRMLATANLPSPAVVKLDVEGYEFAVLEGAREISGSACAPIWLIEVNRETAAAFGYEPNALISELRQSNEYVIYRVERDRLAVEGDPQAAHGVSWACVPPNRRDRWERLSSRITSVVSDA